MKQKRFAEEQKAFALRQADSGVPVAEILRKLGISEATFYRWKKKYGGLGVAEMRRLKQLEDENRRLKGLVAWPDARQADPSGRLVKKALRPAATRKLVRQTQRAYHISERRACSILRAPRSTVRYLSVADPQEPLRLRLRQLAAEHVSYGYQRLYVLLRREGWPVNHKRVYRLYREDGLCLRKKPPRRRVACRKRRMRPPATRRNESWSMDFVSDQLFDGRRLRVLTLVDNHTRESLALHVGQRVRGMDVVQVLEQVVDRQGRPASIRVDNSPEFISRELDCWAYRNRVTLDFSRPGETVSARGQPVSGDIRGLGSRSPWRRLAHWSTPGMTSREKHQTPDDCVDDSARRAKG